MKVRNFGFSLIELMVVMTIIGIVSGGSIVYLNNFNAKQRTLATKNELTSALKTARSYAVTMQNTGGGTLKYVRVNVTAAGVVTVTSDVGGTYFTKNIATSGVGVTALTNPLLLEGYTGKLVTSVGGTQAPFAYNQNGTYIITSAESTGTTVVVTVGPLGQITSN